MLSPPRHIRHRARVRCAFFTCFTGTTVLAYWYKSTNTDARGAERHVRAVAAATRAHALASLSVRLLEHSIGAFGVLRPVTLAGSLF